MSLMKWENKGHEFDLIGNNLAGKKHIYLYGIGGTAMEIINVIHGACKWIDWEIHLVDRDEKKQETGYDGQEVLPPEQFFSMEKKDYFVIACPIGKSGDEIFDGVLAHGISKDIVFNGEYFLYTYLSIYFLYIHDIVFFTSQNILPSTICNLNCRDCLNFTSYIKTHTVHDIVNVKRDIDLFFNAVDLVYRFQITGGEPLLYPSLEELIDYIDKNYRDKILRLEMVTNGTVVPSSQVCEFLSEKKVHVFLDDYTMSLSDDLKTKRKIIKEKMQAFHVDMEDNYVSKWFRLYTPELKCREYHQDNLVKLFNICDNPWSTLENGQISSCNYSQYAAKAGIIDDEGEDYYDLTKFTPTMKKEFVEFRLRYNKNGYVKLCSKCNGWSAINKNWCEPAIQVK
jgi:organic radical activating enzyme